MLSQFLLHNEVNQLYVYVYIYPCPLKSPTHHHPGPSRSSQSIELSSLCLATCHQRSILHKQCMYFNPAFHSSHLLLPFMSVLYVCISIPALAIGSSLHFSRFHTCMLIYYICFSLSDFTLYDCLYPSTSLQMTRFCSCL